MCRENPSAFSWRIPNLKQSCLLICPLVDEAFLFLYRIYTGYELQCCSSDAGDTWIPCFSAVEPVLWKGSKKHSGLWSWISQPSLWEAVENMEWAGLQGLVSSSAGWNVLFNSYAVSMERYCTKNLDRTTRKSPPRLRAACQGSLQTESQIIPHYS